MEKRQVNKRVTNVKGGMTMLEVMIKQLPWRRFLEDNWEVFIDDRWKKITDHQQILNLETGYKYGREYLKWQIGGLSSS